MRPVIFSTAIMPGILGCLFQVETLGEKTKLVGRNDMPNEPAVRARPASAVLSMFFIDRGLQSICLDTAPSASNHSHTRPSAALVRKNENDATMANCSPTATRWRCAPPSSQQQRRRTSWTTCCRWRPCAKKSKSACATTKQTSQRYERDQHQQCPVRLRLTNDSTACPGESWVCQQPLVRETYFSIYKEQQRRRMQNSQLLKLPGDVFQRSRS